MPNKLSIGLAVSLMLSGSLSQFAIADDPSSLESQIMNGDAAPSVNRAKPAPAVATPAATPAAAPAATNEAAPSAPAVPSAVTSPLGEVSPPTAEQQAKEAAETRAKEAAEARAASEERVREAAESHRKEEQARILLDKEHPVAAVQPAAKKPNMLFGRIEQLAGNSGATFPSLKAMTAMPDKRVAQTIPGQTQINNGALSGLVVHSFPSNYQGNWGGHIVIQTVQLDPNYYRVDPEEAAKTAAALHSGLQGDVNFMFAKLAGKVDLEPTKAMFMVPASATSMSDEVRKMYGGNPAMAGMMSSMVNSMPVPISLEFGEVHRTALGEASLAGNKVRQVVLKNEVRQLGAGAVEQQIVTEKTTWDKRTGVPHIGYGETVMKFTTQSPTVMYVQAATVEYGADKKFLTKLVLYGSIGKGVVMNTDPMSAMMGGMGGGGGMGGMGGMGSIMNMFGGGQGAVQPGGVQPRGGTQMQIPGMDPGAMQNMMKQLMGQ